MDTIFEKNNCIAVEKRPFCAPAAKRAEAWLEKSIDEGNLFSFIYNKRRFEDIRQSWKRTVKHGTDKSGRKTLTATYVSPEKLAVSVSAFIDTEFASVEWRLDFENRSIENSSVISNILPIDSSFEMSSANLMTAEGNTTNKISDYEPVYTDLSEKRNYEMSCKNGRSAQGAFPFFDVMDKTGGIIGAIGWTGQWSAGFVFENKKLMINAGMSRTCISLYPGEKMRSPSIVLCFFDGDRDYGHNLWRRLIMKSYTPPDENGAPIKHLPLFMAVHCPMGEKRVVEQIEKCEAAGIEYEVLWMDAGWSGKMYDPENDLLDWYTHTGDWYINPKIYPGNGFKDISDLLKSYRDTKLLVWFEPERAMPDTDVYKKHPEYFLAHTDDCCWELFDFTNDEAVDYIIDVVDDVIKKNGIGWYRQDCNLNPLDKWQLADRLEGENREGIHEIKHITNLYRYVDTLIARNPGLVMDNCASGGRRTDIEMLRRSVILWRTDYTVDVPPSYADGVRLLAANMTRWIPMSGCGAGTDGLKNDYQYRSMQSSSAQIQPIYENAELYRRMGRQYKYCRELMGSDFYILSHGSGDDFNKKNTVLEWYDANKGKGFVQIFRPQYSGSEKNRLMLKGLASNAEYELISEETGEKLVLSGKELMQGGLSVKTAKAYSTLLIYINLLRGGCER